MATISVSPFPDVEIPSTDLWSFLFERSDRPYPHSHPLFVDPLTNRSLSFQLIRQRALHFGHHLQSKWSWQPGDVLVVFAPNAIDLPPADLGYRAEELRHPLIDAAAKAIVTTTAQVSIVYEAIDRAGLSRDRVILLDQLDPLWATIKDTDYVAPHRPPIQNPEKDLSFLVYSSGTTGLPKGVMLSHRNMVANMVQSAVAEQGQLSGTKIAFWAFCRIGFLLNYTIYSGVPMYVLPRFQFPSFCDTIQRHRITYAYVVPPVILELVSNAATKNYDLSSLRMVVFAAAPLAVNLIHAAKQKLGLVVRQAYGMSECAPAIHFQTWSEAHTHPGSVGRLIPNMTAKYHPIHDGDNKEKELWVKGPNVFLGYLNNPTANKESFSEDGYYKTGDVGYEDDAGNFYITDRVKELIKYNGFQVAPAELEGIVLGHPGVKDVGVVGVKSGLAGSELPRAYVVVKGDKEIVEFVEKRVIGYKRLRGGVGFVESIPRNPSGKILRRELKKLEREAKL
ncbi:luciferase [Aspergillus neoniger CBS 115656]|uniref:Luciferase n=1 Tax=Aspergillus neoniger (strain CBS 115656) TaxID=1448310 RepID=A0A318YB20_ASPNB|nr:luciferase [Aspergillus neoniger CBS 115656]PYH31249.1 luciferase [Aspergillus neoniger CBS 115656]